MILNDSNDITEIDQLFRNLSRDLRMQSHNRLPICNVTGTTVNMTFGTKKNNFIKRSSTRIQKALKQHVRRSLWTRQQHSDRYESIEKKCDFAAITLV